MKNIQCFRQENELFIGHCKVKIIHNAEQQKNVGPLVIERNFAYIAPCNHSLLAVMCQDAIRFRAIYDDKGINYLRHELVPIKEISIKEDASGNILISLTSSKSPDFEITLFNIFSDYPNKDFDNCAVRNCSNAWRTSFRKQICSLLRKHHSYSVERFIFFIYWYYVASR